MHMPSGIEFERWKLLQAPVEIFVLNVAALVEVDKVKQSVDGRLGNVDLKHLHGTIEVLTRHEPVAILVPLFKDLL